MRESLGAGSVFPVFTRTAGGCEGVVHAINHGNLDVVVCGHSAFWLSVGPTCGGLAAAWSGGGMLLD